MSTKLVMGDVIDARAVRSAVPCSVPGVTARQGTRKGAGVTIEERLYECANGLALAARRGGPLHLADSDTWEVTTMSPDRVCIGDPAGWITDDQLRRLVALLAGGGTSQRLVTARTPSHSG